MTWTSLGRGRDGEQRLDVFRHVRDGIRDRIEQFISVNAAADSRQADSN
jgi:hypothetical protein